mmetsp:Transcript_31696/g.54043  ORF Transcript_31696/g.54043 Transcript_31696/m.54043 type:complete len:135 (-) Transcript_31696:529-933(-)
MIIPHALEDGIKASGVADGHPGQRLTRRFLAESAAETYLAYLGWTRATSRRHHFFFRRDEDLDAAAAYELVERIKEHAVGLDGEARCSACSVELLLSGRFESKSSRTCGLNDGVRETFKGLQIGRACIKGMRIR